MSIDLFEFLSQRGVSDSLKNLIQCICECSAKVSHVLSHTPVSKIGTCNEFGDEQLSVDMVADGLIFEGLGSSGIVRFAASEEVPCGKWYTTETRENFQVYFDPLDGSSIIDCNWSVGSIYGVWCMHENSSQPLIGLTGDEQVLSAVVVYGPRTSIILAIRESRIVIEATLDACTWTITRELTNSLCNSRAKIFSPANLRSSNDLPGYRSMIDEWINRRLTLRYTGGMVPDIVGNGIFSSPVSDKAKAKLRLVFEVAPIALIFEIAGGSALAAQDGCLKHERILGIPISSMDDRIGIVCGSPDDVYECIDRIYG
jgi:sedoheptulose-bisphosphatase